MLNFSLAICLKLLGDIEVGERSPSFKGEWGRERDEICEGAQGSDKCSLVGQLRIRKQEKSTIGNKTIHHTATHLRGQVIALLTHKNVLTCNGFHKSKC